MSITLEWALDNLLNHPEVLEKTKFEMENHIKQDMLIEEVEATNLHVFKTSSLWLYGYIQRHQGCCHMYHQEILLWEDLMCHATQCWLWMHWLFIGILSYGLSRRALSPRGLRVIGKRAYVGLCFLGWGWGIVLGRAWL